MNLASYSAENREAIRRAIWAREQLKLFLTECLEGKLISRPRAEAMEFAISMIDGFVNEPVSEES